MKITEICIRRPVLATVLSLALGLIGLVSFKSLQVRHYPRIEEPKVSINTQYEGASPDIVETQITKVLEDALSGIEGLDTMTSSSESGESKITLNFKLDRSIDAAANDVRDRIGRVRYRFPPEATDPRIRKADADADPILYVVLYSDRHPPKDLADYAHRNLESQLEVVSGVSSAEIMGGGDYEMHLQLDPSKLAAFRVTAEDVIAALKRQNIEKPAGQLSTTEREIMVTTNAALKTEEDFNNLVITERDSYLIRLRDVGTAKMDAIDKRFRVRYNDHDAVAVSIIKQSTANPLAIAQAIKTMLPRIRDNLPPGMKVDIADDSSIFIERSIFEVYKTIFIASALVILVILFFLRTFQAALIPVVTIPLSLIGAFALMHAFGFTINLLTLLALVMAIGLVVDDSIVILENIFRHIENGMHPIRAAVKGSREISFAVIAMTITLAAVYAPIALVPGMTGRLFTEFALTLAGSVILSGFIALTLSPMMCSRLLRPHHYKPQEIRRHSYPLRAWIEWVDYKMERFLHSLDQVYGKTLNFLLTKSWRLPINFKLPSSLSYLRSISFPTRSLIILCGLAVAGIGGLAYFSLDQELAPLEDQGIIRARASSPQGATVDYVARYNRQVDAILKSVPEITQRLNLVSVPGMSITRSFLAPWDQRKRSSHEIAQSINPKLEDIAGLHVRAYGRGRSLVSSASGKGLDIVIQTTKTHEELLQMAGNFMKALGSVRGIAKDTIEADFGDEIPEYTVNINRDKAASIGVDVGTISDTLDALIGGKVSSHFKRESRRYQVKVEVPEMFRRRPDDISSLFVRGNKGKNESVMVPLSELITLQQRLAPTEIRHFGGLRSITVSAEIAEGSSLGNVIETINKVGKRVLPEGTRIDYSGEARRFLQEGGNIAMIFILALLFIYLVLAAQYESFIDPLIIMLSVPLSLAGGVITLKLVDILKKLGAPGLTSCSINIYSEIGFVTLIGLITKHGILIVDVANKLKEQGEDRVRAIIDASRMRLRPILMTTFAMVVGALPLALATGAGSESGQQIGWVIVGGMSLGTLFTLFVVPAVYTFLSRKTPAVDVGVYLDEAERSKHQ